VALIIPAEPEVQRQVVIDSPGVLAIDAVLVVADREERVPGSEVGLEGDVAVLVVCIGKELEFRLPVRLLLTR